MDSLDGSKHSDTADKPLMAAALARAVSLGESRTTYGRSLSSVLKASTSRHVLYLSS